MFLYDSYLTNILDLVKVEGKVARHRTVHARLDKARPLFVERARAARVVFADARHPTVHLFAAVHVLHRVLAEEKVNKLRVCGEKIVCCIIMC